MFLALPPQDPILQENLRQAERYAAPARGLKEAKASR